MRSVFASAALFVAGVVSQQPGSGAQCLSDAAAQQVATNFQQSISAYTTQLANTIFAPTLVDYADSVSELINSGCTNGPKKTGDPTFDSLQAFIAGQGSQPNITFNILNVWHNCDTVFLRWNGPKPNPSPSAPAQQQPVTGIIVLETTPGTSTEPYLIQTVYSEFNSGAWMIDLGMFPAPNCTTSSSKRSVDREAVFRRYAKIM